ncbi:MAG: Palmitoyltransferase [Chaenotheca gracillima]|nr:MAG: Palmitoyltransferase [Chaenotheca gracillima]
MSSGKDSLSPALGAQNDHEPMDYDEPMDHGYAEQTAMSVDGVASNAQIDGDLHVVQEAGDAESNQALLDIFARLPDPDFARSLAADFMHGTHAHDMLERFWEQDIELYPPVQSHVPTPTVPVDWSDGSPDQIWELISDSDDNSPIAPPGQTARLPEGEHGGPTTQTHSQAENDSDADDEGDYSSGAELDNGHESSLASLNSQAYTDDIANGLLALQPDSFAHIPNGPDAIAADVDRNLDFLRFVQQWVLRTKMSLDDSRFPETDLRKEKVREWAQPDVVRATDLDGDRCDVQGMNWEEFGITRRVAMDAQLRSYGNYTTRGVRHNATTTQPYPLGSSLEEGPDVFQFRSFRTEPKPWLIHFQLRHLVSVASKFEVYYTRQNQIWCYNGLFGNTERVLDLRLGNDNLAGEEAIEVVCLSATNGALVVGGYAGEYALKSLQSDSPYITGLVCPEYAITNHVHTAIGRTSSHPQAVFCSNNGKVRTLDCNTNKFVQEQDVGVAVNCAATSADGRWRVTFGDEPRAIVSSADKGEPLHILGANGEHRDHGFACAWSDDNVHVATASQERRVCIWDARNFSKPLKKIDTAIGAVRNLQFSSTGSGPRQLLMMEAAHTFSLVETRLFEQEQRCTQFGNLAGAGFTPDGDNLFVGNEDSRVGGMMHYERTNGQFSPTDSEDEEYHQDTDDVDMDDDTPRYRPGQGLSNRHAARRNRQYRRGLPF